MILQFTGLVMYNGILFNEHVTITITHEDEVSDTSELLYKRVL